MRCEMSVEWRVRSLANRGRHAISLCMSIITSLVVSSMGLARIAIGLAPMVAPATSAKLLGFPASHDNATARLMGRFFGVRDIGLGVLALWAVRHPETLGFMML